MSSELWEGQNSLATRRKGSTGSADGAVATANDDDDEDLAEEIEDLKRRGVLPHDFPSSTRDGFLDKCSDSNDIELTSDFETTVNLNAEPNNENIAQSGRPDKQETKNLEETVEIPCLGLEIPSLLPNGLPSNWSGFTTKGLYYLESLHRGDTEYDVVEDEFCSIGMEVTKIERLQNMRMLERFKAEMEDVRRHTFEGADMNVKYLYHGTSADKTKLCEEGLDQRLSRMGYFGKGIYFSDTPLKCVHYADDPGRSNPDEAYILKCRVILGDVKVYPHGANDTSLKREPEKEDNTSRWRYYDSVKGCPKDFNEYVVYESRRALIEYIIIFQVNKDLVAKLRSKSLKTSSKPVHKAQSISANQSASPMAQSWMKARQKPVTNLLTNSSEPDLTGRVPRYGQTANLTGRVPRFGQTARTSDTEHSRRIQEVRETVRLKRSQESVGQTGSQLWAFDNQYHPESTSQRQHQQRVLPVEDDFDSEMSDLLTRPVSYRSDSRTPPQRNAGWHAEVHDEIQPKRQERETKSPEEKRSVQQVLDLCIHEFMTVTGIDDSNRARYFVERADMDVNKAISLYYEEM